VPIEHPRGVAAECSELYSIRVQHKYLRLCFIRGRYTNTKIQSEAPTNKEETYEPRESAKIGLANIELVPPQYKCVC